MAKYLTQRTIRHGDRRGKIVDIEPGKTIDLSDEEAAQLVESGAVQLIPEEEKKKEGEGDK